MAQTLTNQSLEEKTLPELYKLYGLNEAKRVINEAKIQRIKNALSSAIGGATVDEESLAEICEENERLFNNHFKLWQAIRKKERVEEDV